MIFEMHHPSPPLSAHLDNIVYYKDFRPETPVEKLLPNGCIYVLLDMEEKDKKQYMNEDLQTYKLLNKCYVSGQHKGFILIEAAWEASMMVVQFKPGGASPFFDFPISRLNNKVEQLEKYWGQEILAVRRRIIDEKDIPLKFKIMTDFLLNKKRKDYTENKELAGAIQTMVDEPFRVSTQSLAKNMRLSQKHLISLFSKHVGLTPKYLSRIYRFQKVLLLLEEKKQIDWLQIVHDCGYYDHAHFIKDFYNFSGINPSDYLAQKGEYLNFVPVKP